MAATIPKTMRALRLHRRAGATHLRDEETAVPLPAMGDVLVQVHAASFTPTELDWPSTWVDRSGHDRRPVIPGHEVAGVVATLGFGTSGLAVGQEVYGVTDWYRDGAAAEYVAVEARNLAPKPATVSHAQAAAAPLAGLTAWQALFVHGDLEPGQRVLVLGAAGGVGTFAVQLARWAGGHVIGTGRAGARDLVLELGAEEFVDAETGRLEEQEQVEPVDLVLDLVGGELLRRSWPTVKAGGRLVSVVAPPNPQEAERAGLQARYFIVEPDRAQLGELAGLIDAGRLRPIVGRAFDPGRRRQGVRRQAGRRPSGQGGPAGRPERGDQRVSTVTA
jgi:NADPH:quinone reductase-like Zn-dependent oxidoreductase